MATMDNLKEAFAGESQANRKYLAYARKAESEGYPQIAKLFRAAAAAETVHAHAHLKAMGGIKSTAENLADAIEGEGFEYMNMYPPYVEEAENDGDTKALYSFRNALAVEQVHYTMYSDALESLKQGGDLPERKVFICDVCGNTVYDEAEDPCAVCGAPKNRFTEIV
ncbi:rubrerythrin family protein [bacterium]|nr:rubrerythrin family protein [bacterium]